MSVWTEIMRRRWVTPRKYWVRRSFSGSTLICFIASMMSLMSSTSLMVKALNVFCVEERGSTYSTLVL